MSLPARLAALADQWSERVIAWRRHLHQHPELSFQEWNTADFVEQTLRQFEGLEITRPTPTSVMATLRGARPGKVLALRADMDALPIQEDSGAPYSSLNDGVMHACGHDGHSAIMLGVAGLLSGEADKLSGEIRFLFQHAEEQPPGGARELVEAGVLAGVDRIFGGHLNSQLETGLISVAGGPIQASPDNFTITIHGTGGHAAAPHKTIDPIAVGVQVVQLLQHIVARETDPLAQRVISVTMFQSGSAYNVIPDQAVIGGTVRTFDPELRTQTYKRLQQLLQGVEMTHEVQIKLDYTYGYLPVINDELIALEVESAAVELFGSSNVIKAVPTMGGEDFSAYQQVVPGVFFDIGAGNKQAGIVYAHHHPKFNFDEAALTNAVRLFTYLAVKYVSEE
ncbi:amidohydrolase [Cohnella abietis]|uniref:N-acyl-L-amino acid amidohydrolase n=1 Tax=Cohnella abietis TaxID=2507935 RepID=A0A3T1DBV6_9BACL|nr:amidohydrolase [Cohnella abietis]BBI35577.1 N-acyl-L-amino acid amidohydrolase [Cohnella abietis]